MTRRPGMWLRAIAARLCDTGAMTHLIDPIVADLQHEYADALRDGATWRAWRVQLAGCFALLKVLTLVQGGRVMEAVRQITTTTNENELARVVRYSMLAMAIATAVLLVLPLQTLLQVDPLLALYIVPQALPLTIPFGLIVGILIAFGGHVISRRAAVRMLMLGAVCSALVFAIFGWLVPSSNYAYQVRIAERRGTAVTSGGSNWDEPLKGPNELTLPEFRQMYLRATTTGLATELPRDGWNTVRDLWFLYHLRWAIPFASLVSVLVALAVTRHRRAVRIAVSLAAMVAYFCLLRLGATSVSSVAPPGVLAWLPNILVAGAALAWMAAAHVRSEPPLAMDAAG